VLSLLTLGVRDLDRARRFYVDGLGGRVVLALPDVVFVQAGHGLLLSLWGLEALRADTGAGAYAPPAQAPLALAHNVASEDEVERVLVRAVAAGGSLVRAAGRAPWGGLQGYLADPDGFHWEVAHNPGLKVHADGRVELVEAAADVTVRTATPRDAVAVAEIHAAGVATGTAAVEPEAPTAAEVVHRIVGSTAPHAFLVAAQGDRVVGWAATSPHSTRGCLSGVADVAVHVDPQAQGRGVGRQLLDELRVRSAAGGLHKLLARVLEGNAVAAALFAAGGFTEAGLLRRHARVDGAWRDCLLVEALLGDAAQAGPPGSTSPG